MISNDEANAQLNEDSGVSRKGIANQTDKN